MIEKQLLKAVEPLLDDLVALEKKVDAIQLKPGPEGAPGRDGVDADPMAVAAIIVEKHAAALRGSDGAPGTPGQPGAAGLPGRDGADADPEAVASVLVEKHADVLRGRDGVDADPEIVVKKLISDTEFLSRVKGDTGAPGVDGAPGAPGRDGSDGIGIKKVTVDPERKSLVLTFDDDQEAEIELPEGPQGEAGQPGRDGVDGLGFDAKAWAPGVYRGGSWVSTAAGKIYRAECDTVGVPGKSNDWERIGPWGFEWKGVKKADAVYEDGDLYIDGGTTFLWFGGKGHMFAQRGAKGEPGAPGKNGESAAGIAEVVIGLKAAVVVLDDGRVLEAPVDGLEKAIDEAALRKAMDVWEAASREIEDEGGTPLRAFQGQLVMGRSYSVGDVVNFNKTLWVCRKANKGDPIEDNWRRMISGGGGGGGGGGGSGITTTTSILANGVLNMGGFSIGSLGNPRNGNVGDADAVNKLYMQQAIAAGTLFQGVYRPAGNAPDLGAKGNTGFAAPAANTALFAPPGAPLKPTDPLRVAVWFQVPDVTFPLTLAAPKHVTITLSNGQAVEFNVPAATYADQNALIAAYLAAAKAANPLILNMIVHHAPGALWMAVETLPAVYATSMSGQIGGGFPVLPPGAANTILNSYSWNIQTTDPNLPEYLPAGLPGIAAGTKVNNSDLLQYNAGLQRFEIIRGGNLTQGFADNRYWQLAHGNMAWQDQAYDKGAVVYGVRFNAWFVATQNIVPGTPEPGTTAAAAVWRKINSTYGSTIFFGKGDYDTAPGHQDAAHNYGMPAGTYPAGQQPLNGDSYYDVTSGTEVQFTVTQNAPLFVITGVTTINTTNQVGTLNNAQMDAFLPAATPLVGQYYFYDAGTAHTALGGSFNGVAFAAGHKYYIVWSGDKDADHNGWVVVDGGTTAPAAGTTKNWSINTPHPQAVPDTITPKVIFGYRRNYSITMGAAAVADAGIVVLENIPFSDGVTHVEIRDTDPTGSVYEFEVVVSSGSPTRITPVSVQSHNSVVKEVQAFAGTGGVGIKLWLNASAVGKTYRIIVTTYDYDLSVVTVGNGTATSSATTSDQLSGLFDYPGAALEKMFKDYQTGKARPYPLKQFDINIGTTVAGTSDFIVLFYGIPNVDAATHVEIRRTDANGSTYEFDVLTVVSGTATLSPVAVKNQDSQFLKIVVGYADATKHYYVGVVCKAKTTTETYQITVSSFDYDLDLIKPNSGADAISPAVAYSTAQDNFKGDQNYPSADLTRFMKAQSGDASASLPANGVLGTATNSPQLDTTYGLKSTWNFYGDYTGKTGNALKWWEARLYKGAGGSAVDIGQAIWLEHLATKLDGTGVKAYKDWQINADFGAGYINLVEKDWPVLAGDKVFVEFTFDTRDTHVAIYNIRVQYRSSATEFVKLTAMFTLPAGSYTQRVSFYPWDSASGSSTIPVIAFKS